MGWGGGGGGTLSKCSKTLYSKNLLEPYFVNIIWGGGGNLSKCSKTLYSKNLLEPYFVKTCR